MLALFWNLGWTEIVLIALVAVLVFGRRLPSVAGDAMRTMGKLRRQLEDLRKESGIDRELYDVRSAFNDLSREASRPVVKPPRLPPVQEKPEPASQPGEAATGEIGAEAFKSEARAEPVSEHGAADDSATSSGGSPAAEPS